MMDTPSAEPNGSERAAIVGLEDQAPSEAVKEFVRALARNQARIYDKLGLQAPEIENYTNDPSPENRAGVLYHLGIALELGLLGKLIPKKTATANVDMSLTK